MAINTLYTLADFTTNSSVTEDNVEFHTTSPCFKFDHTLSPYLMKNMLRFHNETFTLYFKANDITLFNLEVLIGCNIGGDGYGVLIEDGLISLVDTTIFVPTNTILSKDLTRMNPLLSNTYYKLSIMVVNNKLEVFLDDVLVLEYSNFVKVDNYFGYHLNGGTTNVYVSDTIYFDDQIVWGEIAYVNRGDEDGFMLMYDQTDISFMGVAECDADGNYMMFVDEDPVDQNLHIMVGAIHTQQQIQPKGISSVTI